MLAGGAAPTAGTTPSEAHVQSSGLQGPWRGPHVHRFTHCNGTWDFGPQPVSFPRGLTFDATDIAHVKVRAVDTGGLTVETRAAITVVEDPGCDGVPCPPEPEPEPDLEPDLEPEPDPGTGSGCNGRTPPISPPRPPLLPLLLVVAALLIHRRRR
jgi:MYXO-CTERM domain-containing protein